MKQILRILAGVVIMISACSSNAEIFSKKEDCPSASVVNNTYFTRALKFGRGWKLQKRLKYWVIDFIVVLPNAKTAEEALKQGREYFKAKGKVVGFTSNSDEMCFYYPGTGDHFVMATHGIE